MDNYFEKIKEYLKMDTEISYEEFAAFYGDFVADLNKKFPDLDQESLIKSRFVSSILQANSGERSSRKTAYAKKYKKMMEKVSFGSERLSIDY